MSEKKKKILVGRDVYHACVLQVIEEDPDGSPRVLRVLRDDETVRLEGGEKFHIVFALPGLSRRKKGASA